MCVLAAHIIPGIVRFSSRSKSEQWHPCIYINVLPKTHCNNFRARILTTTTIMSIKAIIRNCCY